MVGGITSRTGFFLSSFQAWREDLLLAASRPTVFADLGNGVVLASEFGAPSQLFRSTDYGLTWSNLGVITASWTDFMLYLEKGIVVIGTSDGHIFRSTDYGFSFRDLGAWSGAAFQHKNATYCGNGIVVAINTLGHVFRSTDYGVTWPDLGILMPAFPMAWTTQYIGNNTILCARNTAPGSFYRSRDNGITWNNLGDMAGSLGNQEFLALGNGEVLASNAASMLGGSDVILYSNDYGASWLVRGVIPAGSGLISFIVKATDSLILGTLTGFIYVSKDMGISWTSLGILTALTPWVGFSLDDGIVLFADQNKHVFRSSSRLATWFEENSLLPHLIEYMVKCGMAVKGRVNDAGPAITDFNTDLTEASNNHFNGSLMLFTSGLNVEQAHTISVYTGATRNVAFAVGDQWTDVPVTGDSFVILPGGGNLSGIIMANLAVPGVDAVTNALMRDVTGNKADTAITQKDDVSSSMRYLKGILDTVRNDLPELIEQWQMETGIPESNWVPTNPLTGAAWSRGATGSYLRATSTLNANETARLRSVQRWEIKPTLYGLSTMTKKFSLEFVIRFSAIGNIDNAFTFMGLTPVETDTRASNNVVGWGFTGDVLEAISKLAAAEARTPIATVMTNWNKLKMEVSLNIIRFYVNQVLVPGVAHVPPFLPDLPMYLNWYFDTEAGAAATPDIAMIHAWYD